MLSPLQCSPSVFDKVRHKYSLTIFGWNCHCSPPVAFKPTSTSLCIEMLCSAFLCWVACNGVRMCVQVLMVACNIKHLSCWAACGLISFIAGRPSCACLCMWLLFFCSVSSCLSALLRASSICHCCSVGWTHMHKKSKLSLTNELCHVDVCLSVCCLTVLVLFIHTYARSVYKMLAHRVCRCVREHTYVSVYKLVVKLNIKDFSVATRLLKILCMAIVCV